MYVFVSKRWTLKPPEISRPGRLQRSSMALSRSLDLEQKKFTHESLGASGARDGDGMSPLNYYRVEMTFPLPRL